MYRQILPQRQQLKDNTELSSTFSTEIIPDYNTGFMNLESGAVDAVAMDIVVAKYQIESRSAEFKILDYEIASEQYGVGFAKGNDAVKDQVQKTLEEMAAARVLGKAPTARYLARLEPRRLVASQVALSHPIACRRWSPWPLPPALALTTAGPGLSPTC